MDPAAPGVWRRPDYVFAKPLLGILPEELDGAGENWPPVVSGLFGSAHRYEMAEQAIRRYTDQVQSAGRS